MALEGKTYNDQIRVQAQDHGAMQRAMLRSWDGVLQGCEVTVSDNKIYIAHGWFMACGRLTHINGQEIIEPTDLITNGYIRLRYCINLSADITEGVFTQGYWAWDYSATTEFTQLTQEDINTDGTLYDIEFCVCQISTGNITAVTRVLPVLYGLTNRDSDISAQYIKGKEVHMATTIANIGNLSVGASYRFTYNIPSGIFSAPPNFGTVQITSPDVPHLRCLFYNDAVQTTTTSARIVVYALSSFTSANLRFSIFLARV